VCKIYHFHFTDFVAVCKHDTIIETAGKTISAGILKQSMGARNRVHE
jgi:hypothetical protein